MLQAGSFLINALFVGSSITRLICIVVLLLFGGEMKVQKSVPETRPWCVCIILQMDVASENHITTKAEEEMTFLLKGLTTGPKTSES